MRINQIISSRVLGILFVFAIVSSHLKAEHDYQVVKNSNNLVDDSANVALDFL